MSWMVLLHLFSWGWSRDHRLPRIDGFVCYYGKGEVAALGNYPLAILESGNYTPDQIASIREKGTIVLAYLSIGEILEEPRTAQRKAGIPGEDAALPPYYLDRDGDGHPDRNGEWGSLYVDVRSPEWKARVIDELVPERLESKGADGLFLDTLDTVDLYPETRAGMAELVREIRLRFPDRPLVINRGFSLLEGLVTEVDGILFEAFTTRWNPSTGRSTLHPANDLRWVDATLERIRALGGDNGPQVLVLDYADPENPGVMETAVRRAGAAGLTYCISNGRLDRLPIAGGPGTGRR